MSSRCSARFCATLMASPAFSFGSADFTAPVAKRDVMVPEMHVGSPRCHFLLARVPGFLRRARPFATVFLLVIGAFFVLDFG